MPGHSRSTVCDRVHGFVALAGAAQLHAEPEALSLPTKEISIMLTDVLAHPRSFEQPSSSLCRAVGLAAVAAELGLQVHTLEPLTAAAVERGAAALFLAGYGPRSTGYAASIRLNEKGGERKARPALTKPTRSARSRTNNARSR